MLTITRPYGRGDPRGLSAILSGNVSNPLAKFARGLLTFPERIADVVQPVTTTISLGVAGSSVDFQTSPVS
ncbi:hypothetical protein GCM10025875_33280 [Litorihabitans aurantiacus]|uniref:Uncharacterized protein n=1 Tax=Litorihabitans aurantiacus TaxID=1930061 RepID=A0AA37XHP5_9MICO|nr:hypothetical protein GCM10025875_33280 [Litorihabitans aurantiacus]